MPRWLAPTAVTLLCMAAGYAAIQLALHGDVASAAYVILFAHFLDAIDGRLARLLNATSRFGGELDSFSDLTTFAIAPAVVMSTAFWASWGVGGSVLSFLFAAAGAIRLARFNLDASDGPRDAFLGLPSPVGASLVVGYVPFAFTLWGELRYPAAAAALLVLGAGLMVSSVRYEKSPPLTPARLRHRWKDRIYLSAVVSVLVYPSIAFFAWSWVYVVQGLVTSFRRGR